MKSLRVITVVLLSVVGVAACTAPLVSNSPTSAEISPRPPSDDELFATADASLKTAQAAGAQGKSAQSTKNSAATATSGVQTAVDLAPSQNAATVSVAVLQITLDHVTRVGNQAKNDFPKTPTAAAVEKTVTASYQLTRTRLNNLQEQDALDEKIYWRTIGIGTLAIIALLAWFISKVLTDWAKGSLKLDRDKKREEHKAVLEQKKMDRLHQQRMELARTISQSLRVTPQGLAGYDPSMNTIRIIAPPAANGTPMIDQSSRNVAPTADYILLNSGDQQRAIPALTDEEYNIFRARQTMMSELLHESAEWHRKNRKPQWEECNQIVPASQLPSGKNGKWWQSRRDLFGTNLESRREIINDKLERGTFTKRGVTLGELNYMVMSGQIVPTKSDSPAREESLAFDAPPHVNDGNE